VGEHATEFLATGTAVRRLADEHKLPDTTPKPTFTSAWTHNRPAVTSRTWRGRRRPGKLLCGRGLPDLFFPPVWSQVP